MLLYSDWCLIIYRLPSRGGLPDPRSGRFYIIGRRSEESIAESEGFFFRMKAPAHRDLLAPQRLCWAALGAALLTSACGRRHSVAQVPPGPPAQNARAHP